MNNLLEIWDEPETTGIFTVLNNYDVPWKTDNSYESLNLAYYYNHSGQKYISPLVTGILGTDTSLTDAEKTKIGKLVYDIKHKDWQYLYDALFAEYNPIENYNSNLTETTDSTRSGTNSSSETDTGKDSRAHTGTDTLTQTGTDTNTRTGTETLTDSGTDTNEKTGTETLKDSGTDTSTKTGTEKTEGTIDQTTYHHEFKSSAEKNPGGKSVTQNQIYGFNSTDPSNDSTATTTVTQEVTTITKTMSYQTDTNDEPVLDDDGHIIKEPSKNSDIIENKHSDTTTYDTTETETEDKTHETTYNVKDTETENKTHQTAYNTTDIENIDKTDTTSYNSNEVVDSSINKTITGSDSDTGNVKRTLAQHGNIGVTTSQQMIESEIELRKHNFFEIVFSDIDKYLTLQVY